MSASPARELTCKELVELGTDYLEDRVSSVRRRRIERHLGSCDGCRAYLAQLRALIRAAGRLARDEPSPAVREALLVVFRDWRDTDAPHPGQPAGR